MSFTPIQETPNLRKRPARGSTSKYITKPTSTSTTSSAPAPSYPAVPFPAVTRTPSSHDMNMTFMYNNPNMPMMQQSYNTGTSFANKRKALKFPDRNLHERIPSFIPESKLYTALIDFEKKLDLALTRRQLDVQEAMRVRNTLKQNRVIRLSIYNTYAFQSGTYHLDNKTQNILNEPASWTLRIEGRVVDDQWARHQPQKVKKKFSSFVKKAFFQIGEDVNNTIEWDRAAASGETDGWEIKRAGDQEVEVKITLFLEHSPSKVKLAPLLVALLGVHTDTRPRILMSLWQYIKANRLLDNDDRKTINCDENLQMIFGCDTMQFGDLPKHLRNHLSPPDPVEISHTIKLSGDPTEHMVHYEFQVEVDDTVAIQPSPLYKKEIQNIEEQIAQVIHVVHEHKRKRDFMLEFNKEPVAFLNKLVENQIRDFKLAHNTYPGRDPEEERKTSFFYQPYVEDAVQSYITKHNYSQQQVKVNINIPPNLQTPALSQPQPPPPMPMPQLGLGAPHTPQHPATPSTPQQPHTPQTPYTPGGL